MAWEFRVALSLLEPMPIVFPSNAPEPEHETPGDPFAKAHALQDIEWPA
jgi:hypothetical protein